MFWTNSLNKKVREYKQALIEEERQRNRLVSKDLDYVYLEQLIKRCENNKDLIIEVTLNDGTHLKIKTDRSPTKLKSQEIFEQYENANF